MTRQIVVNEKGEFYHMLNDLNPDIVVGTESWLTPDIQNSEIFPTELNYSVHRRDRETNKIGGGIFILVKNSLVSTRIAEAETNCEILWVKIALNIAKPLLVGAYYKPTENDETSVTELAKSLDIVRGKGNTTWLLGDFNMPHIDWVTNSPNANCKLHSLYNAFLESLDDHNLDQMVTLPTRDEKILDLFCCSNSTLVTEVSVKPGISDHCVIYSAQGKSL